MLRSGNTTTILCEEQTKFILDRISTVEKHFGELCGALAEYTRKIARLRDKTDELAHTTQDYCDAEKLNPTLGGALSSMAKAITLMGDFHDTRVKRLETKIVAELSQYEAVCKHCKEDVKEALLVREKDLAKRKQLEQSKSRNGRLKRNTNDTELIKSNLEVEKSLKEIEHQIERFEKQKLHDLKELLQSFVLIELKMHTQAVEVLSATYQDISDIDEAKDLQTVHKELKRQNRQFKKILQQDTVPDRYFLQRIKSQSMGALNATLAGFNASRKNKSLNSNSLNSSQEQEQEIGTESIEQQHTQRKITTARRSNKTSVQSVESLDSLKRDLSSATSTTSEEDDSEDSETLTDDHSDTLVKPTKTNVLSDHAKKSQSNNILVALRKYRMIVTFKVNQYYVEKLQKRSLATSPVESNQTLLGTVTVTSKLYSICCWLQAVTDGIIRLLWLNGNNSLVTTYVPFTH
ncbi:CBY1-interacting BAR domain-containing protein 1 [Anopheles moucheti]|uniref:CBY1-interacting BAR domain-containing protein 1 n=1 Tax=Anopheles moucheti TaxID=186751 RepID=UPI0022F0DA12|nr:CBY1-interacting BAR domain-containing protein 1 [Anopheles moucheti]